MSKPAIRSIKKKTKNIIDISYVPSLDEKIEPELQLNRAFDVLFEQVMKNYKTN